MKDATRQRLKGLIGFEIALKRTQAREFPLMPTDNPVERAFNEDRGRECAEDAEALEELLQIIVGVVTPAGGS